MSEDIHWNTRNMIYGDNLENAVPAIEAMMQSGNLYVYCSGDPINRVDSSGQNWITDRLSDAWNGAKWAFNTITYYANEAQKAAQRKFWETGSQIILRDYFGYETSAWMLEHSLNDDPSDIWRGNYSRIAYLINNDEAYLSKLDTALRSATGGVINQNLEDIAFNNGDLYYSIHRSTIHIEGYKQRDGSWIIHATMTDVYDFTEIQSFMDAGGGWSTQVGIGTLANDAAVISQKTGAINSYTVTVDFYTTRWV